MKIPPTSWTNHLTPWSLQSIGHRWTSGPAQKMLAPIFGASFSFEKLVWKFAISLFSLSSWWGDCWFIQSLVLHHFVQILLSSSESYFPQIMAAHFVTKIEHYSGSILQYIVGVKVQIWDFARNVSSVYFCVSVLSGLMPEYGNTHNLWFLFSMYFFVWIIFFKDILDSKAWNALAQTVPVDCYSCAVSEYCIACHSSSVCCVSPGIKQRVILPNDAGGGDRWYF